MENKKYNLSHIVLPNTSETGPYTKTARIDLDLPARNRQTHGNKLRDQLRSLEDLSECITNEQKKRGLKAKHGFQIRFASQKRYELAIKSLSHETKGIELLNVQQREGVMYATVMVPEGKLQHFIQHVSKYLETGKNRKLVESIESIEEVSLIDLWTDFDKVPSLSDGPLWWEVWLRAGKDEHGKFLELFDDVVKRVGLVRAPGVLNFPERSVIQICATRQQLEDHLTLFLPFIAELRRAKETADFFDALPNDQQAKWVEDLLERTTYAGHDGGPTVCILDTGLNRGHPLLELAARKEDMHCIDPSWVVSDQDGHGTEMAGLALYGDLTDVLDSSISVQLSHNLESVKILRKEGDNKGRSHGYLTQQAITIPEDAAPLGDGKRVFCMAVASADGRDLGQPTAWSGVLDGLAYGKGHEQDTPTTRLFVVCAGNTQQEQVAYRAYPKSNTTDGIHDPGQAWNVLTVGAYTKKDRVTGEGTSPYSPLAESGALSPFSTTSAFWETKWPMKPDVLFEGGNKGDDGQFISDLPSLDLLTTGHKAHERLFSSMRATSAATALAAKMAAELMTTYPTYWPETIRGLMVHSAQWTDWMEQTYLSP
ncbi:MAG: S8 family peptidase, partial [Magnetococcales bacterium]|nr:S8 family peptidase [Magnetococcales bacterium]